MKNYTVIVVYCCHSLSKLTGKAWELPCTHQSHMDSWILFESLHFSVCLVMVAVLVQYDNPGHVLTSCRYINFHYFCCLVYVLLAVNSHGLGPGVRVACFDRDTSIHTQVSEHVCLSCFCLDIFSNTLLC